MATGLKRETDRTRLIEPTQPIGGRVVVWSHPAFANGRIYLRNDAELRCYSLAKPDDDGKSP